MRRGKRLVGATYVYDPPIIACCGRCVVNMPDGRDGVTHIRCPEHGASKRVALIRLRYA